MGRHVIRGYYVYPAAFASISAGMVAASFSDWLWNRCGQDRSWSRPFTNSLVVVVLVLTLLPGSGLRKLAAYLEHLRDDSYTCRALV